MARRRPTQDPDARQTILDATIHLLKSRRGADVTTDEVARQAQCAKGLVHYHFKGKDQLLAAAAERLWQDRAAAWSGALGTANPKAAIGRAWETLVTESGDGAAAACATLGMRSDELVVRSVNTSRAVFAKAVGAALEGLLGRMRLGPAVPPGQLGSLLAAIIEGLGLHLGSGASRDGMEQAWAAFWAGLLSLTRPLDR